MPTNTHIALFFSSLAGGGAERVMLNLADGLSRRGYQLDLVLTRAEGPYLNQVPAAARIVTLKKPRRFVGLRQTLIARSPSFRIVPREFTLPQQLECLSALARYLRRERPAVMLAAGNRVNLLTLWARRLAGGSTRIVLGQHNLTLAPPTVKRRARLQLIRRFYPWADGLVAVSNGVAEELSVCAGIPRERITTIYNPVVTPKLLDQAQAALDHPWFAPGSPPVVLGVGKLMARKDFPTLLKAFARVRAARPARLLILGEGKKRRELETLAYELGVAADVALPGFVFNPFAFMARAAVCVLSSIWEGLPTVLIEALACGCPVVSTDCPSGPAEILDGGRYGPLVPMGDDRALAEAMLTVLGRPSDGEKLRARAALFSVDRAADQYLQVLLGAH